MTNSIRLFALTSFAAAVCLAPVAKADEWDKKTVMTVNEAIQLPNMVLQPGTYTFKLYNSESDRHIVQVFQADGIHLIATILAIPNYRLRPTGKSQFTFWEVPAGQPPALRAWFYPGDNYGQEFAYPKNMSMQIASSAKTNVPTTSAATADEYKTAEVNSTDQNGASSNLDSNTYTAPHTAQAAPASIPAAAPEPSAAPQDAAPVAPAPEPSQAPAELPHTASSLPLIGIVGLFSMAGYFTLRTKSVR